MKRSAKQIDSCFSPRACRKRGSTHLEIILSFTIFLSFTLFMIVFINPVREGSLQTSVLTELEHSFLDSVESEYVKFPVSTEGACISANISSYGLSKGLVFNSSGDVVGGGVSGGSLIISDTEDTLYWVYLSNESFSSSPTPCDTPGNFEIGFVEKFEVISNSLLEEFEMNYTEGYEALKVQLGFPPSKDFSIYCSNCEEYDLHQSIPEDVEVYPSSFTKEVLYANGTIETKKFILGVY